MADANDLQAQLAEMKAKLARAEEDKRDAQDKQRKAERKQRSAEGQLDSQFKLKSSLSDASGRAKQFKTVDICFVLDCTKSMQPYIDAVKAKVADIGHAVLQMMGFGATVRFAMVGYRDYDVGPPEHPFVMPFTTEVLEYRRMLNSIRAKGGGDWCEDVLTGLDAAVHRLEWKSKVRQLYLISQTPNHGSRFHTHRQGEAFYQGPVKMFNYDDDVNTHRQYKFTDDLMKAIREADIHFHCLEISGSTAQMFEVFGARYNDKNRGLQLKVLPMTSSPASFLSAVRDASWSSIESSFQRLSSATLAAGMTGPANKVEIDSRPIDWDNMKGWRSMEVQFESLEVDPDFDAQLPAQQQVRTHKQTRKVRIAPKPFNKGAMRYAYAMFDESNEAKLVAKVYSSKSAEYKTEDVLLGDVRAQAFARYYAEKFNKRTNGGSPLQFVQVQLLTRVDDEMSNEMMCVEPFIPGEYKKQTNNANYVAPDSEVGQAFSHFTYVYTGGEMMVTDIQGVRSTLTDPQIHSKHDIFGRGNLGVNGMDAFFMVHDCGETCKNLRLVKHPLQLELASSLRQLKLEEQHVGESPMHLSAHAVRKSAKQALQKRQDKGTEWIGGILLSWSYEIGNGCREPLVLAMKRDFLVWAGQEDDYVGDDQDMFLQERIRSLAQNLRRVDQSSAQDDWMSKAEQIVLSRKEGQTNYCEERILKAGFRLSTVNRRSVSGLDKWATLELLAEYADDSDATNSLSLTFSVGSTIVSDVPVDSPAAQEEAKEAVEDKLQWICGGQCGRMVSREMSSCRYTEKGLPKEVFCSSCSQKVHKSWHAKVCDAVGCEEYVRYFEFVLKVRNEAEPALCPRCLEQSKHQPVNRKQPSCCWRMKKCQKCKAKIEYSSQDDWQPKFCPDCAQEGMGTECSESEYEYVPEDYSSYCKPCSGGSQLDSLKTCCECGEKLTGGAEYQCQSNSHFFSLCGSRQCEKKFWKKGEDLCRKSGKGGQQKLDFAKHRSLPNCPTCMLLLSPLPAKPDSSKISEAPTGSGPSSIVSSDTSSVSLISAPGKEKVPKCFIAGTMIKLPQGLLTCVEDLQVGSVVASAEGKVLRVTSKVIHEHQEHELVDMHTENASLIVTASHRIMVTKGKVKQAIPAGSVQKHTHVLVGGGGVEELVQVDKYRQDVIAVEVAFQPDDAVEAYPPNRNTILSRGHGWSKTRRGRRPRGESEADDPTTSMPDTDISAVFDLKYRVS